MNILVKVDETEKNAVSQSRLENNFFVLIRGVEDFVLPENVLRI